MYQVLKEIVPYTLLVVLLVVAYLNLWRRRQEASRRLKLLGVPLLLLVLLSTPAISYLTFGSLEWRHAPLSALPDGNQAVVVLGGWLLGRDQFRDRPTLSKETIYRCFEAADLYRQGGPCLLVATGGAVDEYDSTSLAHLMREFLIGQGVAASDVLEEAASLSTHENAMECRNLLEPRGIERIVLVTDALHMRRAAACFRKAGFEVTPAPCNYQADRFEIRPATFLPSAAAAVGNQQVFHEWLGLCWYWLKGRI